MDDLRIGDRDRDEAAYYLGEEYAAGRLTREEYDERTDAVWSARTCADLADLFTDLVQRPPSLGPVRPATTGGSAWTSGGVPPGARAGGRTGTARVLHAVRRLPPLLLVLLIAALVVVVLAAPFPIWVVGLVWLFVARGRHGCGRRRVHQVR